MKEVIQIQTEKFLQMIGHTETSEYEGERTSSIFTDHTMLSIQIHVKTTNMFGRNSWSA